MGDIGTERREVEFEPLPAEPLTQPVTQPGKQDEPAPPEPAPAKP